jgi:dCMP deaminase
MRIGVAGLNASGKTEVVSFLEARSFYPLSLSDLIREDLARDGLEPTRDHLIERGRSLRERHGPTILAERALARLPRDRNHVIDSIRHPAEVEALRAGGHFVLLWVEVSDRTRFERARRRGRVGTPQTFEAFQAEQRRELASEEAGGQQLLAVRDLADEIVPNDADLAALHAHLQTLLQSTMFFRDRPSWDEYFMDIARVVASRSNCIKRKVGTILAVDRRIVSTGYNGTPRGVRNCNEGGCPRCARAAESGTRLEDCLCSHAEENAITQAAYFFNDTATTEIYTTFQPCLICTKMIINAGIREVVFDTPFPMADVAQGLLEEAGLKVRRLGQSDPSPQSTS